MSLNSVFFSFHVHCQLNTFCPLEIKSTNELTFLNGNCVSFFFGFFCTSKPCSNEIAVTKWKYFGFQTIFISNGDFSTANVPKHHVAQQPNNNYVFIRLFTTHTNREP